MKKAVIQCKACYAKNPLEIKNPGWLSPITVKFTCVGCQSRFLLKVTKVKGYGPDHVHVDTKLLFISEEAKLLLTKRQADSEAAKGSQYG